MFPFVDWLPNCTGLWLISIFNTYWLSHPILYCPMQYWVVLCWMRTELLFIQLFFRERRGSSAWFPFCSESTLLRVRGETFFLFSFTPAPGYYGRTLVLVKLINRCIFYVAVASALMLCDRRRRWEVCVLSLVWTASRSGAKTRRAVRSTPGSSRVQTVIQLDFDESEALSFLSFSFFLFIFYSLLKNPSAIGTIHAHTPPPSPTPPPPQALGRRGRRCVLFVSGEPTCLQ